MANPRDYPFFRQLAQFGGQDTIFDLLLLIGPLLIVIITILGRTVVTVGLASGYILFFLGYLLYKGLDYR